jgi:hypothetical protein
MSNVPVWEKYVMWAMLLAGFVINIVIIAMAAHAKSSLDVLWNTDCPDFSSVVQWRHTSHGYIIEDPTIVVCSTVNFAYYGYANALSTVIGSQIAILVIIVFSAVYWTFIYRKLMKSQGYMVDGIDVNRVAQLFAIVSMTIGYLLQFVVFGIFTSFYSSGMFAIYKQRESNKLTFLEYPPNESDLKEWNTAKTYLDELDTIDKACLTIHSLILTLAILKMLQLVLGHGWAVSMTKQD